MIIIAAHLAAYLLATGAIFALTSIAAFGIIERQSVRGWPALPILIHAAIAFVAFTGAAIYGLNNLLL